MSRLSKECHKCDTTYPFTLEFFPHSKTRKGEPGGNTCRDCRRRYDRGRIAPPVEPRTYKVKTLCGHDPEFPTPPPAPGDTLFCYRCDDWTEVPSGARDGVGWAFRCEDCPVRFATKAKVDPIGKIQRMARYHADAEGHRVVITHNGKPHVPERKVPVKSDAGRTSSARLAELWEAGWSSYEIAKDFGQHPGTIRNRLAELRRAKIVHRVSEGWCPPKHVKPEAVLELLMRGLNCTEIARELGVSEHTARYHRRRLKESGHWE